MAGSILETFFILFQTDAKRAASEVKASQDDMARAAEQSALRQAAADAQKTAAAAANAAKVANANANVAMAEKGVKGSVTERKLAEKAQADARLAQSRAIVAAERAEASGAKAAGEAMEKAAKDAEAANNRLAKSFTSVGDRIGRTVGNIVGLAAVALGGRALIQYGDEFKNLQSQIQLTTKSEEEFGYVNERVFQIAQKSRQGLSNTTSLYASLQRSTENLGYSQERVLGVTETINKAITVSGTSAQAAEAALIQLGQGFASGTLRGEELNSVLEQAPRLAKAIADGMGVQVGELRKLGEAGKITADAVFKALEGQAGAIGGEFDKMGVTVGSSLTVLRNTTVKLVGELDKAFGVTDKIARGLIAFGENMARFVAWLREHGGAVQGFIVGATIALGAMGAMLWGTLVPGWIATAAATLVALAPLIAIGAAVAALVAIFAILWEDVRAFLNGQPSLLGELVDKYDWLGDAIVALGNAWRIAGDIAKAVFTGIGQVVTPLIELMKALAGLAASGLGLVFQAIGPMAKAALSLLGPLLKTLGGLFEVLANGIAAVWDGAIKRIVAALQFLIGLVKDATKAINEMKPPAVPPGAPGTPPQPPATGAAVAAGSRQLNTARTTPLAAQTRSSVTMGARPSQTRTNNVTVGKVEVHTKATDAEGMAKAAGGALSSQLRRTTSQFDDGVDN